MIDEKYNMIYDECNEQEIKDLLIGHTIKVVNSNSLILDNGTELRIEGNEGCGGCGAGWYSLTELNDCDNVITNVELVDEQIDADNWSDEHSYKIFVYAENVKLKLLQVDGDDGNGYYGTGYQIFVTLPKQEVKNEE